MTLMAFCLWTVGLSVAFFGCDNDVRRIVGKDLAELMRTAGTCLLLATTIAGVLALALLTFHGWLS